MPRARIPARRRKRLRKRRKPSQIPVSKAAPPGAVFLTSPASPQYLRHADRLERPTKGTVRSRRRLTNMSRAFVKDTEDVEDLPDRPISVLPNDVTQEGLRQIEDALAA